MCPVAQHLAGTVRRCLHKTGTGSIHRVHISRLLCRPIPRSPFHAAGVGVRNDTSAPLVMTPRHKTGKLECWADFKTLIWGGHWG